MKQLFQHHIESNGVSVMVTVNYLPEQSSVQSGKWYWTYHVRIENNTGQTIQLRNSHWTITDADGSVSTVSGRGVVGEQPFIEDKKSYDFVSGCSLPTASGAMDGHFAFERADGEIVNGQVPHLPLVAAVVIG